MSEQWEPSILIVDDSHFTRRAIRKIIEENRLSRKIMEAGDGVEAVMKYKEHKPTLVTMDVLMPRADGIQALKAIKKIDPDAKVIMMSSAGKKEIVQDSIRAGALDYLLKPFDAVQVAIAISKYGRA